VWFLLIIMINPDRCAAWPDDGPARRRIARMADSRRSRTDDRGQGGGRTVGSGERVGLALPIKLGLVSCCSPLANVKSPCSVIPALGLFFLFFLFFSFAFPFNYSPYSTPFNSIPVRLESVCGIGGVVSVTLWSSGMTMSLYPLRLLT